MAIMQRFKGRISAASFSLLKGGLSDGSSGGSSSLQGAIRIPLAVTAVATTSFPIALPVGATILSAQVITSVAYTGATVTFALGSTAGAVDLIAATTIKAIGYFPLTLITAGAPGVILGNAPALVAGFNFFGTVTQTATFTAVGTAALVIEYTV